MPEHGRYSLTLEKRDRYLFANVKEEPGPRPKGDPCYLDRIAEHCVRCRCSSILIEKHTREQFAVWDAMIITPKLAALGHHNLAVAIVDKGAELPAEKHLKVAIGTEQQLNVRVFAEVPDAESWLTGSIGGANAES